MDKRQYLIKHISRWDWKNYGLKHFRTSTKKTDCSFLLKHALSTGIDNDLNLCLQYDNKNVIPKLEIQKNFDLLLPEDYVYTYNLHLDLNEVDAKCHHIVNDEDMRYPAPEYCGEKPGTTFRWGVDGLGYYTKYINKAYPYPTALKHMSINKVPCEPITYTEDLCLTLQGTKSEYERGTMDIFFNRLLSMDNQCKCDMWVFFDNLYETSVCLKKYEQKFIRKIFIIDLKIPTKQNQYTYTKKTYKSMPEMGWSAGPGLLWFGIMETMAKQHYKNVLVIECDVEPLVTNWLDKLLQTTLEQGHFHILGSYHKRRMSRHPIDFRWHLNGVAIYSIDNMRHIINDIKLRLLEYIKLQKCFILNFDVFLVLYYTYQVPEFLHLYRDIDQIINLSCPTDKDVTIPSIFQSYPNACIVHHKV